MNFKIGFALAAIVTVAVAPIASAHDNGYHHSHQNRGVAGAAIAGDGNNGRRHYGGNGYYNSNTGYYGGYNNGYHTSGHSYGHSYPRTYTTTTYSRPVYGHSYPSTYYGNGGYYSRPRTSVSINIGSGGYYGGRRGYYSRPHYSRPRYRNHRRVHHRRRH